MKENSPAKAAKDTVPGSDSEPCSLSESPHDCAPEPGTVPPAEMVEAFAPENMRQAIADPKKQWERAADSLGYPGLDPSQAPDLALHLLSLPFQEQARTALCFPMEAFTVLAEAAHQRGFSAADGWGLVSEFPGLVPAYYAAINKYGFTAMAEATDFTSDTASDLGFTVH